MIPSEDLFGRTHEVLETVWEFLDLKKSERGAYSAFNRQAYPSAIDAQTRSWLQAYFREHNRRLETYLGTRFGWH